MHKSDPIPAFSLSINIYTYIHSNTDEVSRGLYVVGGVNGGGVGGAGDAGDMVGRAEFRNKMRVGGFA